MGSRGACVLWGVLTSGVSCLFNVLLHRMSWPLDPRSIESPAPWGVLTHGLSSTMDALFRRVSCLTVSSLI